MKRRACIYLMLFIILQVVKSLVVTGFINDYGEGRIEVKMDEGKGIDFAALSFNEEYEQIQPAVLSAHACKVKAKSAIDVLGIGTNSYYKATESLQMNNGAFFGVQAVKEGRNVVVISNQLSMKLFGSDKGTGNSCAIDNATYQVIGVYKKYNGVEDGFLDDGRERIYFPITSKAAHQLKVETLLMSLKNRKTELSINQLQKMQINSQNSFIYNALDAGKKLRTLVWLPLNLLLFFVICHIIKIVIYLFKKQTESLRNKVMVVILAVIGIYFALSIGMKPLYISPEALPTYNIFDISFYIKYFRSQCTAYNYLIQLHLSDYARVYSFTRNIMILLSIVQIGCCFKIKIKKEIFLKEGKKKNEKDNKKNDGSIVNDMLCAYRRLRTKHCNSK